MSSLSIPLGRVRRRVVSVGALRGMVWGLIAATALLLLGAWLDSAVGAFASLADRHALGGRPVRAGGRRRAGGGSDPRGPRRGAGPPARPGRPDRRPNLHRLGTSRVPLRGRRRVAAGADRRPGRAGRRRGGPNGEPGPLGQGRAAAAGRPRPGRAGGALAPWRRCRRFCCRGWHGRSGAASSTLWPTCHPSR